MLISRTDRGYAKNSRTKVLLILFVVLLVLFFVFRSLLQPSFLGGAEWIQNIFSDKTVQALQIENENLKNQIATLNIASAKASSAEGMINMGATDFARASVIVKNMNNVYGSVYINQGKDLGIAVDSIVFAPGLYPIGKVVGVGDKFSRVELFTGSNKKTSGLVKFASSSEEVVELEGDGSYGFVATIPFNSGIKNGDNIYLSESPDFIFGVVVDSILNENENNKIIRVKGFYSTAGIGTVFVQK